jgi:hypothetical protein
MTTFVPKIVRWGKSNGAKNQKYGEHVMAMQWGSGKNKNSGSRKRHEGKTYANAKQNRLSRVGKKVDVGIVKSKPVKKGR